MTEPWRRSAYCDKHKKCEQIVSVKESQSYGSSGGYNVKGYLECMEHFSVIVAPKNLIAIKR